MRLGRSFGLGVALALVSTAALGFEEQKAPAPVPGTGATAAPAAPAGPVELSAPPPKSKSDEGTEVRIPGLGKLGVLPKMDFGLELLYGASEPKPQSEERELPNDELMVRGTVKHSF